MRKNFVFIILALVLTACALDKLYVRWVEVQLEELRKRIPLHLFGHGDERRC